LSGLLLFAALFGLPPMSIPLALLFFNVGVETGEVIFIAAVLVLRSSLRVAGWVRTLSFTLQGACGAYRLMRSAAWRPSW
jgi:hypothetical protein